MYLHLEFNGGSKDEGSPSQIDRPLSHQIDIPADKRIVGVYGHRLPDGEIYSLGFLMMPKLDWISLEEEEDPVSKRLLYKNLKLGAKKIGQM